MDEVFYRIDRIPNDEDYRGTAEIVVDGIGMVHVSVYGADETDTLKRLKATLATLDPNPHDYTRRLPAIPY